MKVKPILLPFPVLAGFALIVGLFFGVEFVVLLIIDPDIQVWEGQCTVEKAKVSSGNVALVAECNGSPVIIYDEIVVTRFFNEAYGAGTSEVICTKYSSRVLKNVSHSCNAIPAKGP